MTKVVAIMSMSLDGYVADANDGVLRDHLARCELERTAYRYDLRDAGQGLHRVGGRSRCRAERSDRHALGAGQRDRRDAEFLDPRHDRVYLAL